MIANLGEQLQIWMSVHDNKMACGAHAVEGMLELCGSP